MEFKLKEQVIVKLFAGCLVDPGLRHYLDRSAKWKEAKFHPELELVIAPYQGKEYIGIFINSIGITVEKLRLIESEVKRKIKEYCPKANEKLLNVQIFSQVFIR